MAESKVAYIAFGANLGKPEETFSRAADELSRRGVEVECMSGLWRSPAWPPESKAPDYVNSVAKVRTDHSPEHLLAVLMAVEAGEGRVRAERNAPRTLDLDIVDFEGVVQVRDELTLPHPRMQDRAFVLLPLSEVAPRWVHPVSREGVWTLLGKLDSATVLATSRVCAPTLPLAPTLLLAPAGQVS